MKQVIVYTLLFLTPFFSDARELQLINFEVITHANKVDLIWSTNHESNNTQFVIERSVDGKRFTELFHVHGIGKENFYMEYFESDYKPIEGVSYYRLKQTCGSGEEVYYSTTSVNYTKGIDLKLSLAGKESSSDEFVRIKELRTLVNQLHEQNTLMVLQDKNGEHFFSKMKLYLEADQIMADDQEKNIQSGIYLVVASTTNEICSYFVKVK